MQIVILPIYRDDQQRAQVMEYVHSLKADLSAQTYAGAAVRVEIDDRDVRGGEKKWHHVKRGVPIRLEVGPKDMENNSVFFARRDQPKAVGMERATVVSKIADILAEMQQAPFDAALKLQTDNSRVITNEAEFRAFFKSENEDAISGGFAYCHFASEDEVEPLLKELKVTIRCIPRDSNNAPGTCFLTGKPAQKQAIFAKAY